MTKLIRKDGRYDLEEGRESGISFSLCVPNEQGFEEIMPLSACKDYLNDAIYGELLNKKTQKIHGFTHTPVGIYKHDHLYLSCAELTSDTDEDPTLINLQPHLDFIHQIENKLGINKTKVVETDNYPILILDKYWGQYPYLISAYGLFFREATNYNTSQSIGEYVNTLKYKELNTTVFDRFFKICNNPPEQDFKDKSISDIHNTGIVNFLRNYEEKQSK